VLEIEDLMMLAADTFLHDIHSVCARQWLAGPRALICESTHPDDEILRLPLTKACISKHMSTFHMASEVVDDLLKHENSAFNVSVSLLRDERAICRAKVEAAERAGDLAEKKARSEVREQVQTATYLARLGAIEEMNDIRRCSKCNGELVGRSAIRTTKGTLEKFCRTCV
jgi:hypothetical protein